MAPKPVIPCFGNLNKDKTEEISKVIKKVEEVKVPEENKKE